MSRPVANYASSVGLGPVEGFGVAYFKASMSGVAAVATTVGDVADTEIDNKTRGPGEPSTECTADALAELTMVGSSDVRGAAAYGRAHAFNWDMSAETHLVSDIDGKYEPLDVGAS